MILDDCPLDSSYQDVSSYFACLRKSVGPAISNINPYDPAYMHVHTTGPNPLVWLCVGIGVVLFLAWGTWALLLLTGSYKRPEVVLNPIRPRTGPYASVVTKDGRVWARTKPASMGGQ